MSFSLKPKINWKSCIPCILSEYMFFCALRDSGVLQCWRFDFAWSHYQSLCKESLVVTAFSRSEACLTFWISLIWPGITRTRGDKDILTHSSKRVVVSYLSCRSHHTGPCTCEWYCEAWSSHFVWLDGVSVHVLADPIFNLSYFSVNDPCLDYLVLHRERDEPIDCLRFPLQGLFH